MPVLDASVLVEYLSGGEHGDAARDVVRASEVAWAPHLVDAEIGHVLRRAVLAREMTATRARAALDDLADLPLRRAGHRGLLERAWALHPNVSFYDGLYVALAEHLDEPLVTLDGRFANAPRVRATVKTIGRRES